MNIAVNNQVKIIYNPYEKTIQYQYRNSQDEQWGDISSSSPLASARLGKGTLQNLAEEIVDVLKDGYCTDGRGVDLFFSGTDPDWEDLKDTVEKCDPEGRIICCDQLERLSTPDEVLPRIQNIFEGLSAQLDSLQDSEVREPIDRYKDTIRPEINLVVTGTYSAGKSSFVNALIGEELLPAASEPTTAKLFKIVPLRDGSWQDTVIRFRYKESDVELRFNQDGYCVRTEELQRVMAGSPLKDCLDKVRQEGEPSPAYLCRIIETLNNFENPSPDQEPGGAVSKIIQIHTPFYGSTLPLSQYKFAIYDTPGSDSANHKEHCEILKKALEEQTNGLPILVTNPDSKDSTSVSELRKILSSNNETLDFSNEMIIINKADEKGNRTLQNLGKTDFAAQEGAKKRIFVLSSLMGLGAKKKDMEQCVSDTFGLFKEKKPSFLNGERQLFRYGAFPRRLSEPVNAAGEAANSTGDDSQKLLHNSGLWAVEYGISDFAHWFAGYNKGQQAKENLSEALEVAKAKLEEKETEAEEYGKTLQGEFKSKEQELINDLQKKAEAELKSFFDSCAARRKNVLQRHQPDKEKLADQFRQEWKRHRKKGGMDPALAKDRFNQFIMSFICQWIRGTEADMANEMAGFLDDGIKRYKTACIQVVAGSDAIDEKQKSFLSQYIMDCPLPAWQSPRFRSDDLNINIFLIWAFFNEKKCAENVIEVIRDAIAKENQKYGSKIQNKMNQWKEYFINGLRAKLADFNPDLKDKQRNLERSMAEARRLSAAKERMERESGEIDRLFRFYKKGEGV